MLHDVKAPDLTPAQATQVSQFRRVAKDLKNDWHDMVRVLDTGDDNSFLDNVGPAKGFFSDFDILVRMRNGMQVDPVIVINAPTRSPSPTSSKQRRSATMPTATASP